MKALTEQFLKEMPIQLIWFFLTERCQLSCDYCFFKDRMLKQGMRFEMIEQILSKISLHRRYDFILSGGEPLLEWDLLVKTVKAIRQRKQQDSITVQTNGLLIDPFKAEFFSQYRVDLEVSFDGSWEVHKKHRCGMKQDDYQRLLENVALLKKCRVVLRSTMTVHPDEISSIKEHLHYLIAQGIYHIDVHPAFLASWKDADIQKFVQQYEQILLEEKKENQHWVCKSYSVAIKRMLELIILPSGDVLPNWSCLTFSKQEREKASFMYWHQDTFSLKEKEMQEYLKDWHQFFMMKRTYRDLCNFHAQRLLKNIEHNDLQESYQAYRQLCLALQEIDQKFLSCDDYYEAL